MLQLQQAREPLIQIPVQTASLIQAASAPGIRRTPAPQQFQQQQYPAQQLQLQQQQQLQPQQFQQQQYSAQQLQLQQQQQKLQPQQFQLQQLQPQPFQPQQLQLQQFQQQPLVQPAQYNPNVSLLFTFTKISKNRIKRGQFLLRQRLSEIILIAIK